MAVSRSFLMLAPLLVVAACGKPAPTNVTTNVAEEANDMGPDANMTAIPEDGDALNGGDEGEASAVAGWVGRWMGPEGLFLDIKPAADGAEGKYALTIKDNLDTQADYVGTAKGDTIGFTRAGKAETIKAGTGAQTGFKWLAEKKDCLIVVEGKEGYCR